MPTEQKIIRAKVGLLEYANPRAERGSIALNSMIASGRENAMSDSVYKVIEVVGTSSKSWEAAAAAAVVNHFRKPHAAQTVDEVTPFAHGFEKSRSEG